MIILPNAVPDPRTVVVIVLYLPYLHTSIAVRAVLSLRRLLALTKGTNKFRLIGLVQHQYRLISVSLYKSRVLMTYHHKGKHTCKENRERDYGKLYVKVRGYVNHNQDIPSYEYKHIGGKEPIGFLDRC